MIRLFVQADLFEGARAPLGHDQAHYLVHVMRLQPGAEVELFNGRDGAWRARLAESSKRGAALDVETKTRDQAAAPDLELVVALVKRARLETIIEKAAELGCRRVRLVITRRTNAERTNVERLQAIATEAAEQCERLDVPQVTPPEKLERVLDAWEAGRRLMYCDESGTGWTYDPSPGRGRMGPAAARREDGVTEAGRLEPPSPTAISRSVAPDPATVDTPSSQPPSAAGAHPSPFRGRILPALDALRGQPRGPWAVLIGPEGGFDPEEQARLRGLPFVVPVGLGPRILRADTAAISALTLWQAALGDWAGQSRMGLDRPDPNPESGSRL